VEFARGVKGHLRVVANVSAIADCLPPALAHFSREHPLIRISLEDQTSAEVQASVAEGRADVGIFVPPVFEARLITWHYARGQLSVIVPDEHPLAEREREGVDFDDLLDYDVVGLHSGAAAQEQLQQLAAARGRTLKARLQVRGFDAIAQLVEAGLGVAVLPSAAAERFGRLFRIKRLALNEDWAEREYLLAVRAQEVLPAVVRRFVETLCPGSADRPGGDSPPATPRQARAEPVAVEGSSSVEKRENSQPPSK
jgi:DNA-binding transcriptional LysR family regulator